MTTTKSTDYKMITSELKNQLTALHYMGLSHYSFTTYCKYGEKVTKYIFEHKLDIIGYIDSWVNQQWQSSEAVFSEFFRLYNEGEELEALRTINIK